MADKTAIDLNISYLDPEEAIKHFGQKLDESQPIVCVDIDASIDEQMFVTLPDEEKQSEFIAVQSRSFWQDSWHRFKKNKMAVASLIFMIVIILLAILVPLLSPYSYDMQNRANRNAPPSIEHILGTDKFGRDIFVRVMSGARISLLIGFAAAFINLIIGVIYGGISGYVGGRVDNIMMRFVDILYSVPSMLYVILIMLVFGSNLWSVLIGICVSSWVGMARNVRSQVLSLKEQEFALAAKVIGASSMRILLLHLVRNSVAAIIVNMTFMIPNAIFTEAYLSFMGIGISVPKASWGTLAQDAKNLIDTQPLQALWPVLAICLTMFALNFIGDTLSDAMDPKKSRGER
jgi:oligopeptide transport system permease protein